MQHRPVNSLNNGNNSEMSGSKAFIKSVPNGTAINKVLKALTAKLSGAVRMTDTKGFPAHYEAHGSKLTMILRFIIRNHVATRGININSETDCKSMLTKALNSLFKEYGLFDWDSFLSASLGKKKTVLTHVHKTFFNTVSLFLVSFLLFSILLMSVYFIYQVDEALLALEKAYMNPSWSFQTVMFPFPKTFKLGEVLYNEAVKFMEYSMGAEIRALNQKVEIDYGSAGMLHQSLLLSCLLL